MCAIERMPQIGGNCTHLGTIPSKSLRAAIYRLMDVNSAPLFRQLGLNLELSFRDLRRSAQSVIDQQVAMRRSFYDRNDVEVLNGDATFVSPQCARAACGRQCDSGQSSLLRDCDRFATVSSP